LVGVFRVWPLLAQIRRSYGNSISRLIKNE
jgi:hypothetical protein